MADKKRQRREIPVVKSLERGPPFQTTKQTIAKDIILVFFSVGIGYLFSINPLFGILCLALFSFLLYIVILELINIPLFLTHLMKVNLNNEDTANYAWAELSEGFIVLNILHGLLESRKGIPRRARASMAHIGDFSDITKIYVGSDAREYASIITNTIIQEIEDEKKKIKLDEGEETHSRIKTFFGLGDGWKPNLNASKTQHWFLKLRKMSITGPGAEDAFNIICDKVGALENFHLDDKTINFRAYVHEEKNLEVSIIVSLRGSDIKIGLEYREFGGLSWKTKELNDAAKNLKNIIKDVKKYNKNKSVMFKLEEKAIEAVKYKSDQRECITIRTPAANAKYKK